MNELELLTKLAAAARRERPPLVDVSARVVSGIRLHREPVNRAFCVFAGACSAAATVVFVVALRVWMSWQDPLNALFGSFSTVMR